MVQVSEQTSDDAAPQAEALRTEVESLKARKGALSRQIGLARKAGQPIDDMVAELKQVSDRFKALNKALKQVLNSGPDTQSQAHSLPQQALDHFPGPAPQAAVASITEVADDPALMREWDQFVLHHPLASPYHLMSVRQAVERAFGHPTRYLCARDEQGRIIGVLPLVQLNSRLFGNFVVSQPFFNYGGALANNTETTRRLVAAAAGWADAVGARHIELRHLKASGLDLPKREDKVSFWLALPKQPEPLWQSFKPKLRAQIRRPQEQSPRIRFGGEELLNDFYRVFARNMRDLGTPVYARAFFAEMLRSLGEQARLVTLYLEGRPVGCAFLIGFRNRMEIPWASTLRETNSLGINMWMYWEILRYTISKGYEVFDFGRCTLDSGTYRFKQQWGAQPVPLIWEYRLQDGQQLPRLNPDNPKFRLMIAVWQRMPVWLTRVLGPGIVRNLP